MDSASRPAGGQPQRQATGHERTLAEEAGMTSRPVSRRNLLASAGGIAAGALLTGELLAARRSAGTVPRSATGLAGAGARGYVPDGTAGLAAAFPLAGVRLLASPFRANQARNTSYLLFVEPDRLLHMFRVTCGLRSAA